jgi:5'-3' exonuclease
VCVCWDWEGSKIKEALYPEYKEARRIVREKKDPLDKSLFIDIGQQIKEVQGVLPYFGIKQVKVRGVEADDVIGLLCEELKDVLVVSSDKDLLQLVENGTLVYYTPRDVLVTKDNFKELFGVPPELFLYYKCILGDASDNIAGLMGFGPKTSAKLVLKYGKWDNWFTNNELKPEVFNDLNKSQREQISHAPVSAILDRNYSLMKAGFLVQDLKEDILNEFLEQTTTFDSEEIEKYFEHKQFSLARFKGWIIPFAMMAYHKTFKSGLNKVAEFQEDNKV